MAKSVAKKLYQIYQAIFLQAMFLLLKIESFLKCFN